MQSIDAFLDQNEKFKPVLELPRVAELIDVTRDIENEARAIAHEDIALRESVDEYRHRAANPVNWALTVYKGLIQEARDKLSRLSEIINRKVEIRTITLRNDLAKLRAENQSLRQQLRDARKNVA